VDYFKRIDGLGIGVSIIDWLELMGSNPLFMWKGKELRNVHIQKAKISDP